MLEKHGDEIAPYFLGIIWWLWLDGGIDIYSKAKQALETFSASKACFGYTHQLAFISGRHIWQIRFLGCR